MVFVNVRLLRLTVCKFDSHVPEVLPASLTVTILIFNLVSLFVCFCSETALL